MAGWIAGILAGLFAITFVIGMVALPFAWRNQSVMRRKVARQMEAMAGIYAEMNTTGAISSNRIREAASRAADIGVVWPPSLFAVLDDSIARGGRL